jgi:hypothetical protein
MVGVESGGNWESIETQVQNREREVERLIGEVRGNMDRLKPEQIEKLASTLEGQTKLTRVIEAGRNWMGMAAGIFAGGNILVVGNTLLQLQDHGVDVNTVLRNNLSFSGSVLATGLLIAVAGCMHMQKDIGKILSERSK